MQVLLTGGFGNVGLGIIHELLNRSHKIRVFELRNKKTEKQAKKFGNSIEVFWGNLLDPNSIRNALEGIDVVIHLGGIIPPLSEANPKFCEKVNVGGTKNVAEEIRKSQKKPPLIFASSASVMGPTQNQKPPISPYAEPNPQSNYTRSKVEAEEELKKLDIVYCICRFGAVLSTLMRGDFNTMVEAFEMPLDNRVEMVLDLDLAVAIVNAAELLVNGEKLTGKIFNIGGGKEFQQYARNLTQDLFALMGIGRLDERCFATKDYYIDWLDTEESQKLLKYQNHSFSDAIDIFMKRYRKMRPIIRLISPILRRWMEKKSPYRT
jgi:nucleoside-diphosphate-sugar epimerase